MGCIAPRRKPVRSDSARRNTALVDDSLTMFPVVRSDGIEHEYQQIVRTAKGTLLAMGPVLLHSQDSGGSRQPRQRRRPPPDGALRRPSAGDLGHRAR